MKYEVITYDVWGNARDGFEVNQAFYSGRTVTLPENASDYLINRRLSLQGVKWDGEPEYSLYGELKRNGMPALELRAVRD
jgi:hypothetical protein